MTQIAKAAKRFPRGESFDFRTAPEIWLHPTNRKRQTLDKHFPFRKKLSQYKDVPMAYEVNPSTSGAPTAAPVVVGLFKHATDAHEAVAELRAQGFGSNQIGAAFRSRATDSYSTDRTSAGVEHESWWDKVKDALHGDTNPSPRSEARVESRADNEYDYEGRDFEGSLVGTGLSADRAAYLTRNLETGGAILTVRDAARAAEAEQIFSAHNGRVRYEEPAGNAYAGSVNNASGAASSEYATAADASDVGLASSKIGVRSHELMEDEYAEQRAADATDRRPIADRAATNPDRVQLFGEVLRVHKDRINRGEVRVRKDVVNENQAIEVPVTREELVLERVPVAADTAAPPGSIGSGQEIRVPLSEEKVRLEKQPVVREEVRVGKREVTDVERVDSDVQHEELHVDSDVETPRRTVAAEEDMPGDLRRHG
jgi:uncharacterized protein (TIGR02271 family)